MSRSIRTELALRSGPGSVKERDAVRIAAIARKALCLAIQGKRNEQRQKETAPPGVMPGPGSVRIGWRDLQVLAEGYIAERTLRENAGLALSREEWAQQDAERAGGAFAPTTVADGSATSAVVPRAQGDKPTLL